MWRKKNITVPKQSLRCSDWERKGAQLPCVSRDRYRHHITFCVFFLFLISWLLVLAEHPHSHRQTNDIEWGRTLYLRE